MAIVKILCSCDECLEDVKEDLAKAFTSEIELKDQFADPLMEDLTVESDSWFNYYLSEMYKEILEEIKIIDFEKSLLSKGKKPLAIGTIKNWSGIDYKKVAEGNWVPVKKEQKRCTNAVLESFGICSPDKVIHGSGITELLASNGYTYSHMLDWADKKLDDFIKEHQQGEYLLANAGHAMSLINGKLTDTANGTGSRKLLYALKVYKKENEAESELYTEAKKYKTAEEYVASKQKLYHGTKEDFDTFDMERSGDIQPSDWGQGAYFTDNPEHAKNFAKVAGGDVVLERYAPDVKFADGNKLLKDSDFMLALDDGMGFTSPAEYLAEKGFGGIKFKNPQGFTEYVVFDPKQIKTKSQLTDIWNKVNKDKVDANK